MVSINLFLTFTYQQMMVFSLWSGSMKEVGGFLIFYIISQGHMGFKDFSLI